MQKETDVDNLITAGRAAYAAKEWTRGGRYFLQALKRAKRTQLKDVRYVWILCNLAYFYIKQKQERKGEIMLHRALSFSERLLGRNHEFNACMLDGLAELRLACGDWEKAEHYYNRSLQIKRKELGSNHERIAEAMMRMAEVFCIQQRFDEAYKYVMDGLSIRIELLKRGKPKSLIAQALYDFAPPAVALDEPILIEDLDYASASSAHHADSILDGASDTNELQVVQPSAQNSFTP